MKVWCTRVVCFIPKVGGAKNGYGEDYLAAGSVILTFFCKDVSQILISYINACFSARLQDLQEKEKKNVVMDDKSAAMHISNVNFVSYMIIEDTETVVDA